LSHLFDICSIFCLLFSWLQVPKEGAEFEAYVKNRLELSYARMLERNDYLFSPTSPERLYQWLKGFYPLTEQWNQCLNGFYRLTEQPMLERILSFDWIMKSMPGRILSFESAQFLILFLSSLLHNPFRLSVMCFNVSTFDQVVLNKLIKVHAIASNKQ
jgi:hypothetical protein